MEDQVSVEDSPAAMLPGDAVSVTVATGAVTVTSTLVDAAPPTPVQVRI